MQPKGTYAKCHGCGTWLTLEQLDRNYNKYKAPFCDECITVQENSESEIHSIESDNEDQCAFCGSEDIYSGSWAPETCRNCGAVWYLGIWLKKGKGIQWQQYLNQYH